MKDFKKIDEKKGFVIIEPEIITDDDIEPELVHHCIMYRQLGKLHARKYELRAYSINEGTENRIQARELYDEIFKDCENGFIAMMPDYSIVEAGDIIDYPNKH